MTSYPADLGPDVSDSRVKMGDPDPHNNLSREIAPEAFRGGILDGHFAITSDQKQLVTSYPVRL